MSDIATDSTIPVELAPEIAALIERATIEIAEERGRQEAEIARNEAKMNAFLARQTALLLDQLDGIPNAIRPYIKAGDMPIVECMATEDWLPSRLSVEVPGLIVFCITIQYPPFSDTPKPTIGGFHASEYDDRYSFLNWNDAITEARRLFLSHTKRAARDEAIAQRILENDERQPTTAERLAALIEEVVTKKVADLLEV